MGSSIVPAATNGAAASDKWTLISSVTPTVSATTVTFSSISGYKKLFLRVITPATTAAATFSMTMNADTGTNYSYGLQGSNNAGNQYSFANQNLNNIPLTYTSSADSSNYQAEIQIINTDTTGLKTLNGSVRYYNSGTAITYSYPVWLGSYFASAAITSLTLTTSSAFNSASGTVSLYGVTV